MGVEEQLIALRKIFTEHTRRLHSAEFIMNLAALRSADSDFYERHTGLADALISAFEHAVISRDPRRALRYLCMLEYCISELEKKCSSHKKYVENI